ncbi:MarR family winged helix-turn-helix transcriptional regulator [Psychrobacillus vulpis]|uniref:MarR family transcriptional regulator n=1 Tax=Psychrobacillus vulpis TaxID=2325572 RepID=A0A544TRV7_9BACI|nr:MarR family transcriptional regulator [Psychrobacillus vulpis]TQR20184.1 MarR family transcriptional regulator [Psychrobacillus vulpis]
MTNEQSNSALKLFIVLSRAHKVIHECTNQFIQENGINPTEFAVLELLYHKGKQPLQQIGNKILLASGSITYVVDKLESRGYISRVSSDTDRRVTFAEITDEGKLFMDELFPRHEKQLVELMSAISEEEKKQAIELVKKLGLSIKNLSY